MSLAFENLGADGVIDIKDRYGSSMVDRSAIDHVFLSGPRKFAYAMRLSISRQIG